MALDLGTTDQIGDAFGTIQQRPASIVETKIQRGVAPAPYDRYTVAVGSRRGVS